MLLAEIPCSGCHDGTLADDDFTILFQRLTHIVFAHEIGGGLRTGSVSTCGTGTFGTRSTLGTSTCST